MMKNIELINDSIQKMANKPSKEAIAAAQSIANEMDDALVSGNGIKWSRWPIENSKSFDVVNVANKKFVCRISDESMLDEVFDIFEGVDIDKIEADPSWKMDFVLGLPSF